MNLFTLKHKNSNSFMVRGASPIACWGFFNQAKIFFSRFLAEDEINKAGLQDLVEVTPLVVIDPSQIVIVTCQQSPLTNGLYCNGELKLTDTSMRVVIATLASIGIQPKRQFTNSTVRLPDRLGDIEHLEDM